MTQPEKILAIDIGGGTQDILIYEDGKPMENCVQLILPSPTRIISDRVSALTAAGKDIFLTGNTMGGGPCAWAVDRHLQAGLKVYATEAAAFTFHDDLERVRRQGIRIVSRPPRQAEEIRLGDLDLPLLKRTLRPYGVGLPSTIAVAVQDHGFQPRGSNRRFRFRHWHKFLAAGGLLKDLIYPSPPRYMTRMLAVQQDAPGAYLMDTCAAAVWGALCDPRVAERREEGLVIVNLGNQHALGALVKGDRVFGVFEHHTGRLTPAKLRSILHRFPAGRLTHEEIFADRGHGCAVDPAYSRGRGYRFTAVIGPRRSLAEGLEAYLAAPYGDMMLAGCFGLVEAVRANGISASPTEDPG
ncbi:MAG: DUF1786 domain-containing protein [Deltaproteobacteria bacterium]|nr:DUF1786 domain-containing protein [Deltaproteobacteria bacterium]